MIEQQEIARLEDAEDEANIRKGPAGQGRAQYAVSHLQDASYASIVCRRNAV